MPEPVLPTPPALSPAADLTEREEQVVRLIDRGYSNKETAEKMSVSPKTVEMLKARAASHPFPNRAGIRIRLGLRPL